MAFELIWTEDARRVFDQLQSAAQRAQQSRRTRSRSKASRQEDLFRQVVKCVELLANDPRHPGLQTHAYHSIEHPYRTGGQVFEAYVQHRTPGAYRLFWCYGPGKGQITVIAITPHP